jgi:hypothetical protein
LAHIVIEPGLTVHGGHRDTTGVVLPSVEDDVAS